MKTAFDEALLTPLLDRFYARVRADALLGPLFNEAVDDWPHHLERLRDFWSSVMLTSGRYKGNPMAMHLKHAPQIETVMFDRWLALWREVTSEMLPLDVAEAMQAKAGRISESLQLALQLRTSDGRTKLLSLKALATPYRSTPVFDQDTLPAALRRAHNTKANVWGVIVVLEGQVRYMIEESGASTILDETTPGLVKPQELHHVEPLGPMRMRVDFYDREPFIGSSLSKFADQGAKA